mgnify:CR=1 FL=1
MTTAYGNGTASFRSGLAIGNSLRVELSRVAQLFRELPPLVGRQLHRRRVAAQKVDLLPSGEFRLLVEVSLMQHRDLLADAVAGQ